MNSSLKQQNTGSILGHAVITSLNNLSSTLDNLSNELVEKIIIEAFVGLLIEHEDVTLESLSDEYSEVSDRWDGIITTDRFDRRVKTVLHARDPTMRYLNQAKVRRIVPRLSIRQKSIDVITMLDKDIYAIAENHLNVIEVLSRQDIRSGVAFRPTKSLRYCDDAMYLCPSAIITGWSASRSPLVFVLVNDMDPLATKDHVYRVDVESTGETFPKWTIEKRVCAAVVTSHGHLAFGWSKKIIEFDAAGTELRKFELPVLDPKLDVMETVPLPNGTGYLICYRSKEIAHIPDRIALMPVDQTASTVNKQGQQQSHPAAQFSETYILKPLYNITGCQMDNKGCVLLMYDTTQVGMKLKVSRPWTLDFVRKLSLPVDSDYRASNMSINWNDMWISAEDGCMYVWQNYISSLSVFNLIDVIETNKQPLENRLQAL